MNVLAVDPGIRGSGIAVFKGGLLIEAAYVVSPCDKGDTASAAAVMASWINGWVRRALIDELALEWPRVYATRIRKGQSPGDPNDLLALAGVDAALAALLPTAVVTCYAPSDWKGQLTKEACHARVMGRLETSELTCANHGATAAKSKAHNMLDAVGIGLHHLGRLERKRVIV